MDDDILVDADDVGVAESELESFVRQVVAEVKVGLDLEIKVESEVSLIGVLVVLLKVGVDDSAELSHGVSTWQGGTPASGLVTG